jgi:hypothetical protein
MDGFCNEELVDILLGKRFRFQNLSVPVYADPDVDDRGFENE